MYPQELHTAEPWYSSGGNVMAADGLIVECQAVDPATGLVNRPLPVHYANARRIAAAVNACQGVPLVLLEGMGPGSFERAKERAHEDRTNNMRVKASLEQLLSLLSSLDTADSALAKAVDDAHAALQASAAQWNGYENNA